jgi:hypothetical protein
VLLDVMHGDIVAERELIKAVAFFVIAGVRGAQERLGQAIAVHHMERERIDVHEERCECGDTAYASGIRRSTVDQSWRPNIDVDLRLLRIAQIRV